MYFKNFPYIQYPKKDNQFEIIKDIITRVGFYESTKSQLESFLIENVPESYTAEKIAEDIYGDQKYFWVVLLYNDFLDPLYSIPMPSRSLDNYIDKKYNSLTLFITPENNTEQFFTHPIGGTSDVSTFREGDTITLYLGKKFSYKDTGDDKILATIKKYIPELSAIQLHSPDNPNIKVGDVIVRGYDTEIRAKVARVSKSRYAVHHFENNGRLLDPLGTPPDDNGNQVLLGETGDGFNNPVGVTQTILENYMNDGTNLYVITNEDYEFNRNERTRKIKLIRPELLGSVLREFKEVLEL